MAVVTKKCYYSNTSKFICNFISTLANAANASDIGQSTLNQVTEFLIQSMNPSHIGDDKEGSILATEILLLLGVQRGKLSHILQWIYNALLVCKNRSEDLYMSSETLKLAIHHIRIVSGNKGSLEGFEDTLDSSFVDLSSAAKLLLTEVVQHSSHSSSTSHSEFTGKIDTLLEFWHFLKKMYQCSTYTVK